MGSGQVQVQLLGRFRVVVDGCAVPDPAWTHRRAADLVALLALAGGSLLRDQVVEALWPDLAPEAGAANLHKSAHHARRVLGEDAVRLRGGQVTLCPDRQVGVDVARFEGAARRARAAGDPAVCAAAADLYPGELLPDRRYEDWTAERRDALRTEHLDLLRGARRWEEVLAAEPADEAAHRAVMRAHLERGDRHAALRQFGRLRATLAGELGVRPGPETMALHREVVGSLARARQEALIGREVELARLRAALGSGVRAVVVTGEAGIGKTRLCGHVLDGVEHRGTLVLRGAGVAADDVSFGAVLRAADSVLAARPELAEAIGPDARDVLATPLRAQPAVLTRAQLIAALDRLCGLATGAVLFVDDAHLADPDSVELLVAFARCTRSPVTILLARRPDPPAADPAGAVEVALGPLGPEESRELVERRCGRRVAPEVADEVWRLAGGHPFFTGEVAALLAECGRVEVPAAALASTLAGLPDELTQALRRVAVAADELDADELAALTGLDDAACLDLADRAVRTGILDVGARGYRFRHALVRHALADGLAPRRRAVVHREAARRLAAAGAHPGAVARHLVAGGCRAEALPWLVRAGDRAAALGACAEALGHVDAALEIEPGRVDLLARRAELRHAAGDPGAAVGFGAAVAAASGVEADALRIRQARILLMAGDVPGTAAALEGIEPTTATRLAYLLTTGFLAWMTGRVEEAEHAGREAATLATLQGRTAEVIDATMLRALVAHSRGRYGEALAADLFDPRHAGVLAGMLSDAHLCVAELFLDDERARPGLTAFATRLRATAAEAGAARGTAFATTLLGQAQFLDGELGPAEENLLAGARAHRELGERGGEALALHRLAELTLTTGRPAAGGPLLDDALEAARFSPLSARHLFTRIYGTMIRVAPDDGAALAVLDAADASLARPAEACPLCWVPYLVPAARLRARTGAPDAAAQLLAAAEQLVGLLWGGRGRWAAEVSEVRDQVAAARGKDRGRSAS